MCTVTLVVAVGGTVLINTEFGKEDGAIVVRLRPWWFGYQLDVVIDHAGGMSAFSISA